MKVPAELSARALNCVEFVAISTAVARPRQSTSRTTSRRRAGASRPQGRKLPPRRLLGQEAPTTGFSPARPGPARPDRKSTRLNSSHLVISYAVFCLKKKKNKNQNAQRRT